MPQIIAQPTHLKKILVRPLAHKAMNLFFTFQALCNRTEHFSLTAALVVSLSSQILHGASQKWFDGVWPVVKKIMARWMTELDKGDGNIMS